jgi:hypothetical protein
MSFARLRTADWVAFVAELALLFATGAGWYSTKTGEEARRIENLAKPSGGPIGEIQHQVEKDAGASLALAVLGLIALACVSAVGAEDRGSELGGVNPAT